METTAHKIEEKERTSDVKLSEKVPFQKMLLSTGVRNGLHRAGYVYPTVLQANAIPIGKAGIDLIVQSKSGTGKTLIFTVVLLEAIQSVEATYPQALILSPTREVAVQIENTVNVIGSCCPGFKAISVIGGLDVAADRKKIQNARVVVGTPGRVLHLIQNEVFNTSQIKLLVLDEADKMISCFRDDFESINNKLPSKKQMIACSATFCNELDSTLAKYMRKPFLISAEKRSTSLLGIKQLVYEMPEEKTNILEMQAKTAALKQIFSKISFKQCIVFANSQSRADSYRSFLGNDGWPCEVICGAQSQKIRLETFNKFREFKTRILVATDLMARGIDSENVNLVINLELPDDAPTYLHRVGRAGRFGSHGLAISFLASQRDRVKFQKLLERIGFEMEILKFPKGQIVDLWNFHDPDGQKQMLGVFDVNENVVECEKENIDDNCQDVLCETSNEGDNSRIKSQKDIKNDMLKHLIDSRPLEIVQNNRCGNLFSDFVEEITAKNHETNDGNEKPKNVQQCDVLTQNSTNMANNLESSNSKLEKENGIIPQENTSSNMSGNIVSELTKDRISKASTKSLMSLVCDMEREQNVKAHVNLFDDFSSQGMFEERATSIEQDYRNVEKSCSSDSNESDQSKSDKEIEQAAQNSTATEQLVGDMEQPQTEEQKQIEESKETLRSLLVESYPKQKCDNVFDDFESFQHDQRNSADLLFAENKASSIKRESDNSEASFSSMEKPQTFSKSAIKGAIREIQNHIVSTSDSQTQQASLNSFLEPQPSTSAQHLDPPLDKSDNSNYPNTSLLTSSSQTKSDNFNTSSITENIDSVSSPSPKARNNTPAQDVQALQNQPRLSDESQNDTDSSTDTASENNESSGYDERRSVPSSGVVTSASSSTSIYSTTEESESTTEESSNFWTTDSYYDSNEYSDTETTSGSELNLQKKVERNTSRRTHSTQTQTRVEDEQDRNAAYRTAFTDWTNLYWNQAQQIQDYVEFYKYAKQFAPRYS